MLPLAPARDIVLSALWPASRARARLDHLRLSRGLRVRSRATVVNLCDYITNNADKATKTKERENSPLL